MPDEAGGGWLVAQTPDGVWLARVDSTLRRDDAPTLVARLRDASDALFGRAATRAIPRWHLAVRRAALPWIALGWPALALAAIVVRLLRVRSSLARSLFVAALAWGVPAAALAPVLWRIVRGT